MKQHSGITKEAAMADLIVVSFDDEFTAEQVRLDLMKLQHEHLVDLEEAAVP